METYIFFDLETTGVDISKDRICELSAIKTDLNLKILEKKTVLINPCVTIPEEATKIHGISNEMVKDKPTFSQYSKALFAYFQGSILAGYNIKRFDIPLLVEEFLRCGLDLQISEVIDCYEGQLHKKVRFLARNNMPTVKCTTCSANPKAICSCCYRFCCTECVKKHRCGTEGMLPVVNSPRIGVCGYTGESAKNVQAFIA